ncbi:MAG TPA: TMEM175 family protein [Rhizomicrobium sp.]|nr:TMEM175 family protein [Rhizomicrobium sp.]
MSEAWRARHYAPAAIDLSRLNALVDGVYSVALTLLILNLSLPQDLSDAELARYWHALVPKALSFVLSFVMAGSAWIYVHQISVLYERTNLGHLIRTVASLMFVCTLPLTTAALGAYPDSPWAPRSIPPMPRCLSESTRWIWRCRETR